MSRPQEFEGVPQFAAVLVAKVRHDDDECTLAVPGQQMGGRGNVVGVRRRWLHVVQLAHQEVEGVDAFARRDCTLCARGSPKGHGAYLIALT